MLTLFFQVSVLLINAIAILSEDRFLARIGWSASSATEPAFGSGAGADVGVKAKIINLVTSIRTLMRSMSYIFSVPFNLLPSLSYRLGLEYPQREMVNKILHSGIRNNYLVYEKVVEFYSMRLT